MKDNSNSHNISGKRVIAVRNELNLFQHELAALVDCEPNYISMIERGDRKLSLSMAKKISAIAKYPAPVAWLMGETDFRTNADQLSNAIQEAKLEADYMFSGLSLLAKLSGYAIEPPQLSGVHDVVAVIETIKAGYFIEKNGASITLSLEEMNVLENHIVNMVDAQLDFLFKLKGGAQNG